MAGRCLRFRLACIFDAAAAHAHPVVSLSCASAGSRPPKRRNRRPDKWSIHAGVHVRRQLLVQGQGHDYSAAWDLPCAGRPQLPDHGCWRRRSGWSVIRGQLGDPRNDPCHIPKPAGDPALSDGLPATWLGPVRPAADRLGLQRHREPNRL